MKLPTFEQWLNEAKAPDSYVNATVNAQVKTLKKGDIVKVDALQYTKGGDKDKMDIILPNGKNETIEKRFLEVKI
jgi:hypothetical protein